MHLPQIATLTTLLGFTLAIIAFFYMRPRARLQLNTRYRLWKLLLALSTIVVLIGILLILLPESIW